MASAPLAPLMVQAAASALSQQQWKKELSNSLRFEQAIDSPRLRLLHQALIVVG